MSDPISILNRFPQDLMDEILKIVITEEEKFTCRGVCKYWKNRIDALVLAFMEQLKKNADKLPETLGLHHIVTIFISSHSPANLTVKAFAKFSEQIKAAIGPSALQVGLITSSQQIQVLSKGSTNLHILWEAIQSKLSILDELETIDEMNKWMRNHPKEMDSITELDLCNKGLTAIPLEMSALQNLKSLILKNNQIQTLDPNSLPPNLKILNLSGNQINNLHQLELNQLRELYLNDNQFTSFPLEAANLPSLTELYLNGNQIHEIKMKVLKKQTELLKLQLNYNQIKHLPEGIEKVSRFLTLQLNMNPLEITSEIAVLKNSIERT